MIYFYTGGAGSGKSFALIQKIKELSDSGKKICVIVPEQYSYEFEKILYNSAGAMAFNNIDDFSFKTLARDIIEKYGDTRIIKEYAGENKRTIITYLALDSVYSGLSGNSGFYRKQYKKTGFAEIMSDFITEIKQSGISGQIEQKKEKFKGRLHEKMQDIAGIYREYERIMAESGFSDSLDDIKESAHIASLNKYFSGKTVIIDEFDGFTGDQYEMIKSIINDAEDVYIGLCTDNINAPAFTLFDTVNYTYRKISNMCGKRKICICDSGERFKKNDLLFLNKNIFRNNGRKSDSESENIQIFEARDLYSEAEYVCAEIRHIIAENPSVKYRDIAVISNNIEDYSPIIESACRRYDIKYFLSTEKDVSHTVIMIYMCCLIEIISADTYNTETIMKYLKTGLPGIELIEISKLENFCFKWSIKGKKWNESFIQPDSPADNEFTECEEIRKKIITPLEKLKSEIRKTTDSGLICMNIYQFIKDNDISRHIKNIISLYTSRNEIYLANEQKKIWDFLMDIINDMYEVLKEKEIPLKQFGMIFRQLMSQAKYSIPPRTLDSVTFASALNTRLNSPKIVFVMGVNDGIFPMLPSTDKLFSADERELLAIEGFNKNKTIANAVSHARLTAYKALSFAGEKLYISYPLTNLEGENLYQSSVIRDIINMFPPEKNPIKHESDISEDFYAVTPKSAYYHLMQNKKNASSEINTIKLFLEENEEYKNKIEYIYKINPQGKNYELSDKSVLDKLVDFHNFKLSNTSLECYSKCHFSYFCKYCLKLYQRQKAEMNNMEWGTLRHICFHRLLESKNPLFIDMSRKQIETIINEECRKYRKQIFKNEFAGNSRTDFLFRKTARQIVIIALYIQSELKSTDFVPTALEANLHNDNGLSELYIPVSGGNIIFNGTIDRIDTYETKGGEKYIRIIDYKSQSKKISRFLIDNGLEMQMLLYMLALTQNGKFKDYIPSGILYAPLTFEYPKLQSSTDTIKKPDGVQDYINGQLKFNGITLKNTEILNAMDKSSKKIYVKTSTQNPPVIPFSEKQLDRLLNLAESKLIEMYESLYSGDIKIEPLINQNPKINPCDYCGFIDICGNSPVVKFRDGLISDTINSIFDDSEKEEN